MHPLMHEAEMGGPSGFDNLLTRSGSHSIWSSSEIGIFSPVMLRVRRLATINRWIDPMDTKQSRKNFLRVVAVEVGLLESA